MINHKDINWEKFGNAISEAVKIHQETCDDGDASSAKNNAFTKVSLLECQKLDGLSVTIIVHRNPEFYELFKVR